MDIVSGINLPMLLSVFENRRDKSLNDIVTMIKDDAVLGIKSLRETLVKAFEKNDNDGEL